MSGADDFVGKANEIVANAAQQNRLLVEKVGETMDRLSAEKDRQTVETLDKIIQVSDTGTGERPQAVFVMTADEPDAARPGDINLSISAYWDLDSITPEASFRVKAELGMPILCKVEWVSAEAGGRKSGPPDSGYSAPARTAGTDGPWVSIVLTWVDEPDAPPGTDAVVEDRDIERTGVALLKTEDHPEGWAMMKPGAILDVHEGHKVVAKVHLSKE